MISAGQNRTSFLFLSLSFSFPLFIISFYTTFLPPSLRTLYYPSIFFTPSLSTTSDSFSYLIPLPSPLYLLFFFPSFIPSFLLPHSILSFSLSPFLPNPHNSLLPFPYTSLFPPSLPSFHPIFIFPTLSHILSFSSISLSLQPFLHFPPFLVFFLPPFTHLSLPSLVPHTILPSTLPLSLFYP